MLFSHHPYFSKMSNCHYYFRFLNFICVTAPVLWPPPRQFYEIYLTTLVFNPVNIMSFIFTPLVSKLLKSFVLVSFKLPNYCRASIITTFCNLTHACAHTYNPPCQIPLFANNRWVPRGLMRTIGSCRNDWSIKICSPQVTL